MPDRPARVLIVDDSDDVRSLLRLALGMEDRFEVVGEAGNGAEAIKVASEVAPDLIVLDRDMPVLSGVEALPALRRVAPDAAVVLFTAHADESTSRVAMGAGADEVWMKVDVPITELAHELARVFVTRADERGDTVNLTLGPLPSAAACVWIPNTMAIVAAVQTSGHTVGLHVPDDVSNRFLAYLREWLTIAENEDEFFWAAAASADDARRLVEYWSEIDKLTDVQLAQLGCAWSPPEGESFFVALTTAVVTGLDRHADTANLAAALRTQWAV